MEMLATALLAFFSIGYLVLGGGDVGVGMLLPWLGRTARERRTVIAAIGPFILANEVWLVAVAGILAGAFPGMEHELLYEHRTLFIVLLLGWVIRDAGLWWRARVDAAWWRTGCDALIVAGSWTLALSHGCILGSVLLGSALPGPLLAAVFALHGAGFARLRLTGALRARTFGRFPATALLLAGLALGAGARLDLAHAAAGPDSLKIVTVFVLVLLPLLLAGQALTWWTFRHRVTGPGYL